MPNALYSQRDRNALMEHKAFQKPSVSYNAGKVNALATMVSPIPVLGDVAGLAADAAMYAKQPESRTWLNYLMTAAGALPFVPGAAHAIFAGPLAKTADLTALERAKGMAKLGTPDDQIWRETGWWVNTPDGVPRFEIDDSNSMPGFPSWGAVADVKQGNTSVARRQEALLHPKLSAAYPDTKNIGVILDPSAGDSGSLSSGGPFGEIIRTGASRDNGRANRSTMLHELQHAVQGREGMASGGAPSDFTDTLIAEAQDARDALAWGREIEAMRKKMPEADLSAVENAVVDAYQAAGIADWVPSVKARNMASRVSKADLENLVKDYGLDRSASVPSKRDLYRRLAGETEARAVQERMNFTPDQRRATPPWESYDVPLNALIVRK